MSELIAKLLAVAYLAVVVVYAFIILSVAVVDWKEWHKTGDRYGRENDHRDA